MELALSSLVACPA